MLVGVKYVLDLWDIPYITTNRSVYGGLLYGLYAIIPLDNTVPGVTSIGMIRQSMRFGASTELLWVAALDFVGDYHRGVIRTPPMFKGLHNMYPFLVN